MSVEGTNGVRQRTLDLLYLFLAVCCLMGELSNLLRHADLLKESIWSFVF